MGTGRSDPAETPPSATTRPRRRATTGLGIAVLLVGVGALGWWLGSQRDPGEDSDIVDLWAAAVLAEEPAALADLYTDDAIFVDATIGRVFRRGPGIEFMARNLGFEVDFTRFELLDVVVDGDVIVARWDWEGTTSLTRSPAGGAPFARRALTVMAVEDGQISMTILQYGDDRLYL